MSESALPLVKQPHPLRQPRILVPLVALLLIVNLPFLHQAFRGAADISAAVPFEDKFERAALGGDYWSNGGDWRIASGQLYSPGVGNNPLWLKARLPADVRIEFDVRSEAADGDVKWEAFGDGRNHASGYVFLFGGWHNRESRICKLDEHAFTEPEIRAQLAQVARPYPQKLEGIEGLIEKIREPFAAFGARRGLEQLQAGSYFGTETPFVVKRLEWKVEKSRVYHMRITKQGKTVRWEQDGKLVLEMIDPAPLSGRGHDRFGFSSWQNDTYFDNLKIDPL